MGAESAGLFLILLGPTVFLGATFPLVNRIYARSIARLGRSIGTAYALNTIGAILGSFVAGFILVPVLGKENGLRLVIALQFIVALMALTPLVYRTSHRKRQWITGLAAAGLGALLLLSFPSWNRKILSRGWYRQFQDIQYYLDKTT